MSNRIHLDKMEFKNYSGEVTYGFKFYDDQDTIFVDWLEKDEMIYTDNPFEFLEFATKILYCIPEGRDLIDFCTSNEHGMHINGDFHIFEEITIPITKAIDSIEDIPF